MHYKVNKMKKIKVMWIAYQPLAIIAKDMGMNVSDAFGGWLEGAAERINFHGEIELIYCFPNSVQVEGNINNIQYYSLKPIKEIHFKDITEYKDSDFKRFKSIVEQNKPDIIQIYGTEQLFQRQYIKMAYDMGMINKTIVWIQGLVLFCAQCYNSGFTIKQIKSATLWEKFRRTNISGIQKRLALNGKDEVRCLKLLKNVFVRTDWDYACCKSINENLCFYKCNETLRSQFYENKIWNIEKIERHSIFISQYSTPIKGFHILIKALPIILKEFPDTIIYTTGKDLLSTNGMIDSVRESSYLKILRKLIVQNNLEKNVKFLGVLNAEDMRNRYIMSHVSVLSSEIENSSNSIGEAIMLGVPLVAADVGGVSSMVKDKEHCLLYPFYEYAMLAENICKIFRSDELANNLSESAKKRAQIIYNKEKNYNDLINSYKIINGDINGSFS